MSSRKISLIRSGENSTSGEHFFQGGLPYDAMFSKVKQNQKPVKAFLMVDQDQNIIESFSHDDTRSKETIGTLRQAAEVFSNCHAAMVGELTGGA